MSAIANSPSSMMMASCRVCSGFRHVIVVKGKGGKLLEVKSECTERSWECPGLTDPYMHLHVGMELAKHDAEKQTILDFHHVKTSEKRPAHLRRLHDVVFPLGTGTSCSGTVGDIQTTSVS